LRSARGSACDSRLSREAICAIADEFDRTLDTRHLYAFRASEVIARIEVNGHIDDEFWHHVGSDRVFHVV